MKFVITSMFGALEEIRSGVKHTGMDLAMPKGTPLRSIADGVVERVTHYHGNIGEGVIIRASDGSRHIFGHMDHVDVVSGQSVHTGTLIGTSGNSGFSTGPHLHFGLWKNGSYQDPSTIIEKVDAMAGNSTFHNFLHSKGIFTSLTNSLQDNVRDRAHEIIIGILQAVGDVLQEGTMIMAAILIILKAVGFNHPWIRPGVVIALNLILRVLLGGV